MYRGQEKDMGTPSLASSHTVRTVEAKTATQKTQMGPDHADMSDEVSLSPPMVDLYDDQGFLIDSGDVASTLRPARSPATADSDWPTSGPSRSGVAPATELSDGSSSASTYSTFSQPHREPALSQTSSLRFSAAYRMQWLQQQHTGPVHTTGDPAKPQTSNKNGKDNRQGNWLATGSLRPRQQARPMADKATG